jgi:hypothetical protein
MNREQIESRLYTHAHYPETITVSISGDEYTLTGKDDGTGNVEINFHAHGHMWKNISPITLDRTKSGLNAGTMGGTGDGQLLYAFFNNTASRFLGFGLLSLTDDPANYYTKYYHIKTYPLIARYNTDTPQTFNHNVSSIVNFDTLINDTHDCVDVGASWKFTAPYSGYYAVCAQIAFNDTTSFSGTTEYINFTIFKNDAFYSILMGRRPYANENFPSVQGSDTVYLDKGDYIYAKLYQNSGNNLNLYNFDEFNYINIYLIS